MAKPKGRKENKPGVRQPIHLPNFGAEAALGPASRTYRSPMEAYPGTASAAVLPSQLDQEAPVDDESDTEGADIDNDEADEATGALGSDESDEGDETDGDEG